MLFAASFQMIKNGDISEWNPAQNSPPATQQCEAEDQGREGSSQGCWERSAEG